MPIRRPLWINWVHDYLRGKPALEELLQCLQTNKWFVLAWYQNKRDVQHTGFVLYFDWNPVFTVDVNGAGKFVSSEPSRTAAIKSRYHGTDLGNIVVNKVEESGEDFEIKRDIHPVKAYFLPNERIQARDKIEELLLFDPYEYNSLMNNCRDHVYEALKVLAAPNEREQGHLDISHIKWTDCKTVGIIFYIVCIFISWFYNMIGFPWATVLCMLLSIFAQIEIHFMLRVLIQTIKFEDWYHSNTRSQAIQNKQFAHTLQKNPWCTLAWCRTPNHSTAITLFMTGMPSLEISFESQPFTDSWVHDTKDIGDYAEIHPVKVYYTRNSSDEAKLFYDWMDILSYKPDDSENANVDHVIEALRQLQKPSFYQRLARKINGMKWEDLVIRLPYLILLALLALAFLDWPSLTTHPIINNPETLTEAVAQMLASVVPLRK